MPSATQSKTMQDFEQKPDAYLGAPLRKESFDAVYGILRGKHVRSVVDLGTASGDFLYFLDEAVDGYGVDKSEPLIDLAERTRARPNLAFRCLDMLDDATFGAFLETAATPRGHRLASDGVDAVTLLGFLSTFRDFRDPFDRIFSIDGWRLLVVHAPFNDFPYDMRHASFDRSAPERGWQSIFNIPARQSVVEDLERRGVKSQKWESFVLSTRLEPNAGALDRAWHVDLADGSRMLTNGFGVVFNQYILTVER